MMSRNDFNLYRINLYRNDRTPSLLLEQRKGNDFTVVPEYDTLYTLCDLELCFWLSKFVHEIKKKDGSEYPPNTLYQICAGLQRALRENGLPELDIFRNPRYKLFQDSIDSRMKTLTRTGMGVNVEQAKPIPGDEEEILWPKGLLGEDDPRMLVNTFIYLASTFRFEVARNTESCVFLNWKLLKET